MAGKGGDLASSVNVRAMQFGYDLQTPLFADFSHDIPSGSHCLLVGANGSMVLLAVKLLGNCSALTLPRRSALALPRCSALAKRNTPRCYQSIMLAAAEYEHQSITPKSHSSNFGLFKPPFFLLNGVGLEIFRIVWEHPEYGYATYFFEILYSLPTGWHIRRLVIAMKLTGCGRISLLENRPLKEVMEMAAFLVHVGNKAWRYGSN